ncbi:MAG: hypothetical protein AABY53_05880 [Bdellovibrionota bacterium]
MLKGNLNKFVTALVSLTFASSIGLAGDEQCTRTQLCLITIPIIGGGLGCIELNRCEPKEPRGPKEVKEPREPKEVKEPREPRIPGKLPDRHIRKSL